MSLILTALLAASGLATLAYIVSLLIKDSSIADVFWGLYFVAIAIALLVRVDHPSKQLWLAGGLVTVWAARLSWHIAKRKLGKPEDWRYAQWRKKWGHWFTLRSYLQNFLFQALLATVIAAPLILAAHSSINHLSSLTYAGAFIWLAGFCFETIADRQLANFLANRQPSQIMQAGLWRFSRHPNYFGEVVQWWGLWLMVVSLPFGWLAVVSPLTITGLILFVSGVPLLEKRYKNDPAYQTYAGKTSVFVPLPPKT